MADLAVVPLQDVLSLGTEARMNFPGTAQGNWRWRLADVALTAKALEHLRELTEIFDRLAKPAPAADLSAAHPGVNA